VWSHRALANRVSGRGRKDISPVKAEARRKEPAVTAGALLQVSDLKPGLLSAQDLFQETAKRRAELSAFQKGLSLRLQRKLRPGPANFVTLHYLR
jgi:hypothetical protein